ncbi:tetraspanin-1-like [Chanos chanos]|uniref:Tetraspanin n=1 Tax=Chanos chanos TaxID=29144 RepID=A0A6J2VRU1_CHACN|nr:tetraspanin-1-like [Chanos chanos]
MCHAILKIIMFVFNGTIFAAGAAILGVGIWVTVDKSSLLGILEDIEGAPPELSQLANVGYLLIAVGAVLGVMGFLGCCGAIMENKCMLLTFFIIILIIFIAEVAGAIVVLVFQPVVGELLEKFGEEVAKTIEEKYGTPGGETFTSSWNTIMKEFKCCGYNNYTDFSSTLPQLPKECCEMSADTCTRPAAEAADVTGCFKTLLTFIEDNIVIIAGVALGIAALEIAAMIVSMILYNKVGK